MADHTRIFGSALPVGADDMGDWPDRADEFKDDFSERYTLDHYMDGTLVGTSGSQDGRHRKVTMKEMASPTEKAETGIVFTKDFSSLTEFCHKDSGGEETQITSNNEINYSDFFLSMNTIFSRLNKKTGTIASSAWTTLSYNSPSRYSTTVVSYPDGTWNKANTVVLASSIEQKNGITNVADKFKYIGQPEGNARRSIKSRSFHKTLMDFAPDNDDIFDIITNENKNAGYPNYTGCTLILGDSGITIYASPLFSGGAYTLILGKLL